MRKRGEVYMIGVFMIRKGYEHEMHTISWYHELKDAEDYLNNAGRLAPGYHGARWDDPFECRWTHCVIERVPEGRHSTPVVCSWWKSVRIKGGNVYARKLKHPPKGFNIKGVFGFTFPT
jgi:hypothetical protein